MTPTNLNSLILFNFLQNLINYHQLSTLSLYQSSSNIQSIYNNTSSLMMEENNIQDNKPLMSNQSFPNKEIPNVDHDNDVIGEKIAPVKKGKKTKRKRHKKRKSIYFVTKCPHKGAKHYAKNMCSACYHSKGRNKRAWKCEHIDQPHYALGLCKDCYQVNYFKRKKRKDLDEDSKSN